VPFIFLVQPDLLEYISPQLAQTAEHWLKEGPKLIQASRFVALCYFGSMIAMTLIRLGYFAKTKNPPPSIAEYPKLAYDVFVKSKNVVNKAQVRLVKALGDNQWGLH